MHRRILHTLAAWPLAPPTAPGMIRADAELRRRYTLRYGVQPATDDHFGVSPFRNFLLLSMAAVDKDPAPRDHDATVELSAQTLGGKHPAVLSIDPPAAKDARVTWR